MYDTRKFKMHKKMEFYFKNTVYKENSGKYLEIDIVI